MKAKKRLICATGMAAVLSIAGAFFFDSLKVCFGQMSSFIVFKRVFWLDTEFWLNFCFTVFGSSLLGLIMSWVEYFVERKEALERYFSAAVDVSSAFAKVK